jgi:pilus assembly protein Flp/PilA
MHEQMCPRGRRDSSSKQEVDVEPVLFLWTWLECNLSDRFDRMRGQGMVEYALILVLVAIVVVAVLVTMGQAIQNTFQNIVNCLNSSGTGCGKK